MEEIALCGHLVFLSVYADVYFFPLTFFLLLVYLIDCIVMAKKAIFLERFGLLLKQNCFLGLFILGKGNPSNFRQVLYSLGSGQLCKEGRV